MRKYILFVPAVLMWFGCQNDAGESGNNPEDNIKVERLSTVEDLPEKFAHFYTGKIGKSLEIGMRLERDGNKLSGIYWYTKNKVAIPIEGTFSNGEVVLKEYGSPNQLTGTFTGKYSSGIQLGGNWRNPKGDLTLGFSLTETSEETIEKPVGESAEVKTIVISKNYTNPKGVFEYAYPDFAALGLPRIADYYEKDGKKNQRVFQEGIEDGGDEEEMGSDWQGSSTIHYRGNGLISVYGGASYYFAGAAHPNSSSFCELWSEAGQKQIKLEELFIRKANWLEKIAEFCKKDLKTQIEDEGFQADVEENIKEDADLYQNFLVSDKGLEVIFDTYTISAYIYGSQSVLIPWSVLSEVILPDGPAGPFKQ